MNKITLYLMFLLFFSGSITVMAQIENFYTFSEGTEEYVPLVGANEIILTRFTFSNIFIPFEFEFAGKEISFIRFFNNGSLVLEGGTVTPQPNDLASIGQQNFGATSILAPLWDNDMSVAQNNTTAKRNTLLEGIAPNRTYTIEWENVLWGGAFSDVGSEVSFRVIFEETTNNITFLYGPNTATADQSASIGFNTEFAANLSFVSITPGSTATASSMTANNSISTSDYPGEGTRYTFTYSPPSCSTPSRLDVEEDLLTPFTAAVNWENADSETAWDILVINLEDQTSTTVAASNNPFTISNLNEDTNYSISIRSNCQTDGVSEYSPQHFFSTPAVCPQPISLETNNITLDSADFTWTPGDLETVWEVAVVEFGDPEPALGTMVSDTNYSVSGLIKDTDYVFYVRADCGVTDGFSQWSTLDFRTLATCNAPTNVIVSNEACSSFDVAWEANNSETSWEVLLQRVGSSEEFTISTNTNPVTIENLDSNRTYRVFVRSICAVDDISRYSRIVFGRTSDDEPPVANCIAPFTLELDDSGNATITVADIDNGSTDNCLIDILSIDKTTFTSNDIGDNIVTLTVTDQSGNSTICTTTITIEGTTFSADDYITGLSTPRGLACDTNGDLYVAEHFSGRILRVTDVETSTEFASTGFLNNNISFDSNGLLYTTDDFFSQIFQIDSNGNESVYLNGSNGVSSPWGIAFDADGNLYYSNQFRGEVIRVTPDLTSSIYVSGLFTAEGIAFDSNGNLFIADRIDRRLIKVTPDGTQSTILSNIRNIRAVAIDSEDNIYFNSTENGFQGAVKIIKYSQIDESQTEIVSEGLTDVNELKFNADGDLFVAQDDRVSVIRDVDISQTLSVEDFVDSNFILYPNPVVNTIYTSETVQSLKIYDLSGKSLFESKSSGKYFDIIDLASGVYIVEVKGMDNRVEMRKIVKESTN